jgi:creatinine amidohydrolase
MDFPRNMLKSLYCREEFLALLVRELLDRLIQLEYKLIVLVNGHGALNQIETLDRLAREFTACSPARVQLTIAFPVNFDFKFGHGSKRLEKGNSVQTSPLIGLSSDGCPLQAYARVRLLV